MQSHRGRKSRPDAVHCGSELARESGGSACIDAGCADAFASKLAPTEGSGVVSGCRGFFQVQQSLDPRRAEGRARRG
ncbi:hypothetical protein CF597_13925 [Pseudomonas sp. PSB1]|nr:hypothetical protein [Pseudomonas sp. PSB1]